MHNYKGSLRREQQDLTPTKSSFEHTRENLPPQQRFDSRNEPRFQKEPRYDTRYDTRNDSRNQPRNNDTRNQSRNEIRNDSRFQPKFERSELSYYQSQSSKVYYDQEQDERPSTKLQQQQPLDQKYYYNNLLRVVVKSSERDEYEQRLRVVIHAKVEKGQHQLLMNLTDDANPKFLWIFSVKEVDFLTLKNSQKLKVSYAAFPEMLENYLRQCEQSQSRSHFLALETRKGQGKLLFQESGRYRVATHLELSFKLASDEELKDHLAAKLMAASTEIDQNRVAMRNMEHTLDQRMKELEHVSTRLNALAADRDRMEDQFKMEMTQRKTEQEAIKLNELTKAKKEAETEVKDLKQRLNAEIQGLNKQKTDLSTRLAEAREKVSVLQGVERDQTMRITRLEQDYSKTSRQVEQLRNDNRELSERRFQNEKTITELTCRTESLRSELEDKKTIITSTVQLKETNNNQIYSLQQLANDQKKQLARADQKISELESQLAKVSTNSAELLQKLGRQKEKLQQRGDVIKQQEKQLKDLKKNEAALERNNERLTYERDERDNKVKALNDQLEKVQKKFEEQQAMVAYLQKNLNERPGLRTNYYPPTSTSPYQPPSYINRQPSQLSNNSNITSSRITHTQKVDKYEPNIKRYEDRPKSPLPNRLPQQKDPQDDQDFSDRPTKFDKPIPVKFKMSQPKE